MNYDDALKLCVFRYVSGSHAYGTNRPDSDEDIRGVFIAPLSKAFDLFQSNFVGAGPIAGHLKDAIADIETGYYTEAVRKIQLAMEPDHGDLNLSEGTLHKPGVDEELHELRKFLKLAAKSNPNILEFLYVDRGIKLSTPIWCKVREQRHLFLSKKARYTFSGYAHAQLERIQTHRGYLLNPPDHKPTRGEFGLNEETLIAKENQHAILSLPDKWINEAGKDYVRKEKAYHKALEAFNSYRRWVQERNPDRRELEKKYGFDCYLDDTEFLTKKGWKKFDNIPNSLEVATLNRNTGCLEFQIPTERFCEDYSGNIVFFQPQHMDCAVTPNHRMFISEAHRSKKNPGARYDLELANWRMTTAESLISGNRTYFHTRMTCRPPLVDFDISDDFLILMGCYVSEGSIGKRLSNGTASVIRISQKAGNRIEKFMDGLMSRNPGIIRDFKSNHKASDKRTSDCLERIWTVAHRPWAEKLHKECGDGAKDKRLPLWTIQLSFRQACLLLEAMVAGDGTERKLSRIYYTSSRRLADDIQTMCVASSIISQVWGPYECKTTFGTCFMYQVYIGRPKEVALLKPQVIHMEKVLNRKIVCFTVPNDMLITRRNGKIAIQGNCKHAMHLIRLCRMGIEIIRDGVVNVYRPDREELKGVLRGEWSYEKLVAYAQGIDSELDVLYKTSPLQDRPAYEKITELYISIAEEHYGIKISA